MFVKSWDDDKINLAALPLKIKEVKLMVSGKSILFNQTDKQISFHVPAKIRDSLYTVIELITETIVPDSLIVGSRSSMFSDEVIYGKNLNSSAILTLSSKHSKNNNEKQNVAFLNNNNLTTDYAFCTAEELNPCAIISFNTFKNITGISISNKPGYKCDAVFNVQVSKDSISWESIYTGKYNKDYWEIPVNDVKTGAEVPGKLVKYIRIEAISQRPMVLQLRKAEVYGKD